MASAPSSRPRLGEDDVRTGLALARDDERPCWPTCTWRTYDNSGNGYASPCRCEGEHLGVPALRALALEKHGALAKKLNRLLPKESEQCAWKKKSLVDGSENSNSKQWLTEVRGAESLTQLKQLVLELEAIVRGAQALAGDVDEEEERQRADEKRGWCFDAATTRACTIYSYVVHKLELANSSAVYLYFLNQEEIAAICTFYLKKGAVSYLHIRPV